MPKLFSQLEDIESIDDLEISYYFYENDSTDNTASILSDWLKNRKGKLRSENLDSFKFGRSPSRARMAQMCYCRNLGKDLCEDYGDISMVFDSDIEFSKQTFLNMSSFLEANKQAVMVTPNVVQEIADYTLNKKSESYYDIYPFRDRWGNNGLYFSSCPFIDKRDQRDWELGEPIEALSAFGGFSLIKPEAFQQVKWSSDFHCDHVNMCMELSKIGKIYVHPLIKVRVDLSGVDLPISSFKQTAAQQQKLCQEFNELRELSHSLNKEKLSKYL